MRIKQINPRGWYDIPGYDGKYQINYFGNVRRALKRGYKALHPYIKTTNGRRVVKLNCKEQVIMKLMQITFIGELPPGMVTYHKNGIITDDALNNIGIITRSELGRLTGRGNGCETSVVKISEEGQIVDFYRSVREAGRKNHMSYQTILDRINGKVKSLYAPDGYVYCKANMNKQMKQLLEESEPETIIAIHNHPGSSVPSLADLMTCVNRGYYFGLVACHDGKVYKYWVDKNKFNSVNAGFALDRMETQGYDKEVRTWLEQAGVYMEVW